MRNVLLPMAISAIIGWQDKYASFMQFIPFVVVVAQNIDCGYALQRSALIWRFCRVANVSKHKQWVHIRTGYSHSMFKKKTLTSSNSLAVHVKYVILLCTFLSKKKKKNVHNKITYLTKIVGTR